jgi:hypothetical protein
MDTVTVQIPVSVLLGDRVLGAGLASVSGSGPAVPPPATATPMAVEANQTAAVTPSPSRPRKLLSDIGRKYWDKAPKSRTSN